MATIKTGLVFMTTRIINRRFTALQLWLSLQNFSHGCNFQGCNSYTKPPDFTAGSFATIAFASSLFETSSRTAPPALSGKRTRQLHRTFSAKTQHVTFRGPRVVGPSPTFRSTTRDPADRGQAYVALVVSCRIGSFGEALCRGICRRRGWYKRIMRLFLSSKSLVKPHHAITSRTVS